AHHGLGDRRVSGVQTCALPILRVGERTGVDTHSAFTSSWPENPENAEWVSTPVRSPTRIAHPDQARRIGTSPAGQAAVEVIDHRSEERRGGKERVTPLVMTAT